MVKQTNDIQILLDPSKKTLDQILSKRGIQPEPRVREEVKDILNQVKSCGDKALKKYTCKFDKILLDQMRISTRELGLTEGKVSSQLQGAIRVAKQNIQKFHEYYQGNSEGMIQTMPGVECFVRDIPIQRVGLYIPGGNNPLFSSLLMLAIPAKIAGCKEIMVCTPPTDKSRINPLILYCADLLRIKEIYKIGGAQAIAAMAYGTRSIPKVDKIFGPGNDYVTEAKQQVQLEGVAIDMPAGPSEVMIVADETAHPNFVVADILSQLEHGKKSQAVLLTKSLSLLKKVEAGINDRLKKPVINPFIKENMKNCRLIFSKKEKYLINFMNKYAPEHLILAVKYDAVWATKVKNAGSVFLGNFTPESLGDYASGPNHTLPTGGWAKVYSGLSVQSFKKRISFQRVSKRGFRNIAATVEIMAEAEHLKHHKEAVSIRLREMGSVTENQNYPLKLLRGDLKYIKPYQCARQKHYEGEFVFLDANELPLSLVKNKGLNRYPDPSQRAIKKIIAKNNNLTNQEVLLGNGSDEVIDLLIRAFCYQNKDNILITPPTYGIYEVFARNNGIGVVKVLLNPDFNLDVENIIQQTREHSVKLIFLNSPNNPTGNSFVWEDIKRILKKSGCIVIVDEAYIDFSTNESLIKKIKGHKNLFIIQTFSKSWGAAGIRIGMLFGDPEVLAQISKIKAPYNISSLNLKYLLRVLNAGTEKENMIQEIIKGRKNLKEGLETLNFVKEVYPSETNFLLVSFLAKEQVFKYLKEQRILVRDRSNLPLCSNCLRISIGTEGENKTLMEILKKFQEKLNE